MAVKDKNKKQPVVKVKAKKETILVEMTKEVEAAFTGESYNGKKVLKVTRKFGKNYLIVDNTI